ncbi:DUF551 domain-containing protein [Escherichia coli]
MYNCLCPARVNSLQVLTWIIRVTSSMRSFGAPIVCEATHWMPLPEPPKEVRQ